MTTKETLDFRLGAIHAWVESHARKSEKPSRYLDHYESGLKAARKNPDPDDVRVDYTDPVRVAAEIEAWAALRRAQQWYTRDGLCVKR